jgi:LysM repeat protein
MRYIVLLFISFSSVVFAQDKMNPEDYIAMYADVAVKEMNRTGIPASITIAQGILESGNGNSDLATKAKNHFGIKCHNDWKGPSMRMDDDEANECFRKYKTAEHSFRDHSDFLTQRKRYAFLFEYKITDYKAWALGLKKAGYATNPKYPQLLISLIEKYNLTRFDKKGNKRLESRDQLGIFEFNRIRTVSIRNGDNVKVIAKRHEVPVEKLIKYNDLKSISQKLNAGDRFYLSPKRNVCNKKYHIVRAGETFEYISNEYGVKLKLILRRNFADKNDKPIVGEKVYLNKKRKGYLRKKKIDPNSGGIVYIVKKGDTLYGISKKFDINIDLLIKVNKIDNNVINEGQKLIIKTVQ